MKSTLAVKTQNCKNKHNWHILASTCTNHWTAFGSFSLFCGLLFRGLTSFVSAVVFLFGAFHMWKCWFFWPLWEDSCGPRPLLSPAEKSSNFKWRQVVDLYGAPLTVARHSFVFGLQEGARSCCRTLTPICLSLSWIPPSFLPSRPAALPSCTLHKPQLLIKRRLQTGGIPAAGVSQPPPSLVDCSLQGSE